MKYGETLRKLSVPEWGHYNVDYDEIKQLIKEHTTPGNGKALSIPGQGRTTEREFETQLYSVFVEQYERISLFVRSKSGEIERRLDHLSKQIRQLRLRDSSATSRRLPAKRLERYGRVEEQILRAGEEIRLLSRFIVTQRVAFVKLLKKYKKWTGSESLGSRFREECLDRPESFTKVNLEPLLEHWAEVLHAVRQPFQPKSEADTQIGAANVSERQQLTEVPSNSQQHSDAAIAQIHASEAASEPEFDTALATTPLGNAGSRALYWIHIDQLVELQVLLLQYLRLLSTSSETTVSGDPAPTREVHQGEDTGVLLLGDKDTFGQQPNTTNADQIEDNAGSCPTIAAGLARWASAEEALVAVGIQSENTMSAKVKRKDLPTLLDIERPSNIRQVSLQSAGDADSSASGNASAELIVRNWLSDHPDIKPLVGVCSKRTRFVGLGNNASHGLWATLDWDICMKKGLQPQLADDDWPVYSRRDASRFPHAVLEVRQEGADAGNFIQILDDSHLTERVPEFSLETHAVYTCCKPASMSTPPWLLLLQKDIRKLLESMQTGPRQSSAFTSPSRTLTPGLTSRGSTAAEQTSSNLTAQQASFSTTATLDQLPPPALSTPTKKKRQDYEPYPSFDKIGRAKDVQSQRYWNEYDNPEDMSDEEAYVIYIDPNATWKFPGQATVETLARKIRSFFSSRESAEHRPLLSTDDLSDADYASSISSEDGLPVDESRTYGTNSGQRSRPKFLRALSQPLVDSLQRQSQLSEAEEQMPSVVSSIQLYHRQREDSKLRLYTVCLSAALVLLITTFILAATGRRKQRRTVDVGILIGIAANMLFTVIGIGYLLSRRDKLSWLHRFCVFGVFVAVCVGDGGVLAWLLT